MLVKFNSTRILGFQKLLIVPGLNDIAEEIVMDMQDDEILAGKFDSGELEIVDREDLGAKKVKVKPGQSPTGVDLLLAASDKNAKNLVATTVSLPILETWLIREKRIPLKKLIRAQIDKIKNIEYREEKTKKLDRASKESDEE